MHKELRKQLLRSRAMRKGLTLSEVIVASALLISCIVPILKGLTAAHIQTSQVERKTKSLVFARNKINEIQANSVYNWDTSFAKSNLVLDSNYLCKITDSAKSEVLREASVSVGFDLDGDNNLDNDEVEINLKTLLARRW